MLFSSGLSLFRRVMSRIYDDNSLAIGNTPLVKLNKDKKNCTRGGKKRIIMLQVVLILRPIG